MQHKSDQNAQLDAATSFKLFGLWSMLESLPSRYVPGFRSIPHMTCLDESCGLWPNRHKRDILANICSQEMWLSHAYTLADLVKGRTFQSS